MSPKIRLAIEEDRELYHKACYHQFLISSFSNLPYNKNKVDDIFNEHLKTNNGNVIVLISEPIGCLVGLASENAFADGMIASELCWWAEDNNKKVLTQLFRAYEYWANKVGCSFICKGEQVKKLYKNGYDLVEQVYIKDIR